MNIGQILSNLGFDWQIAFANLINFLIILWLLKRYAFTPIKNTLETRKKLSEATTKQLASGKMRRENTSIESEMERELQRNNIYYQKQVPLCNITVVDFYLPEYKIAIYADGAYWHNLSIVKERDEKQSKILEENGYKVFRFREHEIKKSVKRCVNEIRRYVQIRDGPVSSGSKILLGKNKIYV